MPRCTPVACPELAPLIQEGGEVDERVVASVERYCEPLRSADVDTVILGCTHYPLVRPLIQRTLGRGVAIVTSGEAIAAEVDDELRRRGLHERLAQKGRLPLPLHRRSRVVQASRHSFPAAAARRGAPARRGLHRGAADPDRGSRRQRDQNGATVPDEARRTRTGRTAAGHDRAGLRALGHRLDADRLRRDARHLHRVGGGGRAALAPGQGARVGDRRVRDAARVHRRAQAARRLARAARRSDGRDPAADRSFASRRDRLRGVGRADGLGGLRRARGRRRHPLRCDHRWLRGASDRAREPHARGQARPPPAEPVGGGRLLRHRRRRAAARPRLPRGLPGRGRHERGDDRRRRPRRGAGHRRAHAALARVARRAARARRLGHRAAPRRTGRARPGRCPTRPPRDEAHTRLSQRPQAARAQRRCSRHTS